MFSWDHRLSFDFLPFCSLRHSAHFLDMHFHNGLVRYYWCSLIQKKFSTSGAINIIDSLQIEKDTVIFFRLLRLFHFLSDGEEL